MRHRPQDAAGQLGERVMRHVFAAVQKERNFVTAKRPRNGLMIHLQVANQHGTVPETVGVLLAHELQQRPRREDRFGFGIGTGGYGKVRGKIRFPARGHGQRPASFQLAERGMFREPVLARCARQNFRAHLAARQCRQLFAAALIRFSNG